MVWCASRVKQYISGRSWILFAQTARIIWKNAYLASAPSTEVLNQRTMKWNSSKSLGRKGVGRLHETFAENDTGDVACLLRLGASHTLCVGIDFWLPHIRPFLILSYCFIRLFVEWGFVQHTNVDRFHQTLNFFPAHISRSKQLGVALRAQHSLMAREEAEDRQVVM